MFSSDYIPHSQRQKANPSYSGQERKGQETLSWVLVDYTHSQTSDDLCDCAEGAEPRADAAAVWHTTGAAWLESRGAY